MIVYVITSSFSTVSFAFPVSSFIVTAFPLIAVAVFVTSIPAVLSVGIVVSSSSSVSSSPDGVVPVTVATFLISVLLSTSSWVTVYFTSIVAVSSGSNVSIVVITLPAVTSVPSASSLAL